MLKQKYEDALTNERLTRQCRNQFDLVGRAVKVAEYLVKSGKATTEWPDNISYEVLRKMSDEGVDVTEREVLQEG